MFSVPVSSNARKLVKNTSLESPDPNSTTGNIGVPLGAAGGDMLKMARIVAIAIHTLESARNRPGHILLVVIHNDQVMLFD